MNRSAQAIIVDRDENIYLERNSKIWSLSFVWWALEEWEDFETALQREIWEELCIPISVLRLLDGKEQEPRRFPTWEWLSKYFVLVLEESEEQKIRANAVIEMYSFNDLQRLDDSEFPMERMTFLAHIQRALDLIH